MFSSTDARRGGEGRGEGSTLKGNWSLSKVSKGEGWLLAGGDKKRGIEEKRGMVQHEWIL